MEYPYQVVTFFNQVPEVGDFVYQGEKGWFPQLALKRRFSPSGNSEAEMLEKLSDIARSTKPFEVILRSVGQPKPLPVEVIEVEKSKELMEFHLVLFQNLGQSKFPDREGANYYPHMTISWEGRRVIEADQFENTKHTISEVWVIKDDGTDCRALKKYPLRIKHDS